MVQTPIGFSRALQKKNYTFKQQIAGAIHKPLNETFQDAKPAEISTPPLIGGTAYQAAIGAIKKTDHPEIE